MKKTALIVLTAIVLAFSLTACGDGENAQSGTPSVQVTKATQPEGWVSNEYTDVLPIVPSGLVLNDSFASETDNSYSVMLGNAGIEDAKKYMQSLKNAGFTTDVSEAAYDEVNMCMFSGKNAQGYTVEMIYSSGTIAITVRK